MPVASACRADPKSRLNPPVLVAGTLAFLHTWTSAAPSVSMALLPLPLGLAGAVSYTHLRAHET
eukprot:4107471-Heterocapsa_arctica.AAC.1